MSSRAVRSANSFEVRCIFGKIRPGTRKFRYENSGTFSFRTWLTTGLPFRKWSGTSENFRENGLQKCPETLFKSYRKSRKFRKFRTKPKIPVKTPVNFRLQYTHAKNGLKTVLGRSGAEIIGLLITRSDWSITCVYIASWSKNTLRIALASPGAEINGFLCFWVCF